MKENFNQNIIKLNSKNLKSYKFPDRFSNEIYFSNSEKENEFLNISYVSPFTIKYAITGYELYNINGKTKKVDKDKMIIVNSGSQIVNETSFGNAFSIFLDGTTIQDCYQTLLKSQDNLLQSPLDKNLIIPEFCDFIHRPSNELKYILNKLLNFMYFNSDVILTADFYYEFVEKIIISQNQRLINSNQIESLKPSTKIELYKKMILAKDYLEDNLNQSFNLEDLGKVCCMSKYSLIRTFKKVHGTTPNRYFLEKKIEKAKKLLLKNLNVTEVADSLNYTDIQSFSKQFKSLTGKSPSDFKKSRT